MADVLSQSQIDSLLNALTSGSASPAQQSEKKAEKSYRKYDFNSPKKFTKDKLRLLNDVFDKYARITATQVGGVLRMSYQSEVVAIEEQRYYEFSNALGDDEVLTVVNVELPDQSKNKPVLMHISPKLMANFIDRMLGGADISNDVDVGYVYTEIEEVLYQSIIKHFIAGLKESWESYLTLRFDFSHLEVGPGMFQSIGMDETIVITTLHVTLSDEVEGVLSICFPGNLLSDIFIILDRRINREKEEGMNYVDSSGDILHYIRGSELDVCARVGDLKLSLSDIYNLQVGDVINLSKPKDSEVEIAIDGEPWFIGKLGQHNKNVSVLITDTCSEETL